MANSNDYVKKHDEIVKSFQPSQLMKGTIISYLDQHRRFDRYGSCSQFSKYTSANISGFEGSGHYLSDREKFNKSARREDIVEEDKKNKILGNLSKIRSIQRSNEFIKERNDIQNFLDQQKKMYSINEKSKKLRIYEMVKILLIFRKIV